MAFEGEVREIPVGYGGLSIDDNFLQRVPTNLLQAEGVTMVDTVWRKESGASLYDVVSGFSFAYRFGLAGDGASWAGFLAEFAVSNPLPGGFPAENTQLNTSISEIAVLVPAPGYAAGTLVIAWITSTNKDISTVSFAGDSKGNTYSLFATLSPNGNTLNQAKAFYSRLSTSLTAGDIVFASYTASGVSGNILIDNYAGTVSASPFLGVTTSFGESISAAVPFVGSTTVDSLFIGGAAVRQNPDASISPYLGAPGSQFLETIGTSMIMGGDPIDLNLVCQPVNVSPNNAIIAFDHWLRSTSSPIHTFITRMSHGEVYKENPFVSDLDFNILAAGLASAPSPPKFVTGGQESAGRPRKLFHFDGINPVKVYSDPVALMTDLSSPPVDWVSDFQPTNGFVHGTPSRLWGFGNINQPHVIYSSTSDDHENFTSGVLKMVGQQVGERLWGVAGYQQNLFFGKFPKGIFVLDDTDPDELNWRGFLLTAAIGCAASPYSMLEIDDDVLILNSDGTFHLLSDVRRQEQFQRPVNERYSDLTERLRIRKWIREHVNLARLDQALSVWYPHERTALFALPKTGSISADLILKFDFSGQGEPGEGRPVKFSYSYRDFPTALGSFYDVSSIQRTAHAEGVSLYLRDQEARLKGTIDYNFLTQTAFFDFATDGNTRDRRKNWKWLELIQEPTTTNHGTIRAICYIDGGASPAGKTSQVLDFSTQKRRQRKRLVGNGYTLSVLCSNAASGVDPRIVDLLLGFTWSDEAQRDDVDVAVGQDVSLTLTTFDSWQGRLFVDQAPSSGVSYTLTGGGPGFVSLVSTIVYPTVSTPFTITFQALTSDGVSRSDPGQSWEVSPWTSTGGGAATPWVSVDMVSDFASGYVSYTPSP